MSMNLYQRYCASLSKIKKTYDDNVAEDKWAKVPTHARQLDGEKHLIERLAAQRETILDCLTSFR